MLYLQVQFKRWSVTCEGAIEAVDVGMEWETERVGGMSETIYLYCTVPDSCTGLAATSGLADSSRGGR